MLLCTEHLWAFTSDNNHRHSINMARLVKEDPSFSLSKIPEHLLQPRAFRPSIIQISSRYRSLRLSLQSVLMLRLLKESSHRQAIRYRWLRRTILTSFLQWSSCVFSLKKDWFFFLPCLAMYIVYYEYMNVKQLYLNIDTMTNRSLLQKYTYCLNGISICFML